MRGRKGRVPATSPGRGTPIAEETSSSSAQVRSRSDRPRDSGPITDLQVRPQHDLTKVQVDSYPDNDGGGAPRGCGVRPVSRRSASPLRGSPGGTCQQTNERRVSAPTLRVVELTPDEPGWSAPPLPWKG